MRFYGSHRTHLQRLALAVQAFRNLKRLGKRKHRKIRQSSEYSELCRAWEEAADFLDSQEDIVKEDIVK